MNYPDLATTPIKEIIFSVSYQEIIEEGCFNKFVELEKIKNDFNDIKPSINRDLNMNESGVLTVSEISNGFHLKNENEILQLKQGLFSYHYINGYKKFEDLLDAFMIYWNEFNNQTKESLTTTVFSVRYINLIETDSENQPTHLVQLYPRKSSDIDVSNFQNSIVYRYQNNPEYEIHAISSKLREMGVLLDITVKGTLIKTDAKAANLKFAFKPLQEIKNKAFFDAITARALLKYIQKI